MGSSFGSAHPHQDVLRKNRQKEGKVFVAKSTRAGPSFIDQVRHRLKKDRGAVSYEPETR